MEEAAATPVLTKQQQKHALSGKKKKQQGRTLFASPYDTYWPEIKKEDEEEFSQLLRRSLEPIGKSVVKVDWRVLRKLPREERKEARRKMQQEIDNKVPEDRDKLKSCLYLGANEVTRGLESSGVAAVLLTQDVDPRFLISHIPIMCGIQRIPALVLPALRQITRSALGFTCIALGIKKKADDSFQTLLKAITLLSEKIPVPEPYPSYCIMHTSTRIDNENEEEELPSKPVSKEVNVNADVYKYRTSKKERAFVPGREVAVPSSKPSTEDFLAFSKDEEEPSKKNFPEFSYRPLRLKRLAPNPDKIRKKQLKKRRKHSSVV